MSRKLVNKHMVERHNKEVADYWKQQEAKKIVEDTARANETRKQLDVFDRVMNPGISGQEIRQAEVNAARKAEQTAKQQYDAYKQSAQRGRDWDTAMKDAMAGINWGGGNVDLQIQQLPDNTIPDREKAYAAVENYYEQNRKAAEDRNMMEDDVAQVEAMSAEDRKLLETYAFGRNEWFDHKVIGDSVAARAELERKYGKQKVEELAESWQRYQNAVTAEKNRQQTQEGAGSGSWAGAGHTAASLGANALGTLTAPFGYLQEAFGRTGRYQTLDPNNAGALPGQYASAVREQVASDIETGYGKAGKAAAGSAFSFLREKGEETKQDPNLFRKGAALLYRGGMSAADNLVRIAMGGGTTFGSLGLAALGSFGSTLSEASAQGATPGEAVLMGVANAGIEMATEKLSLDELFKAGKSGLKGAKQVFGAVLKQGGVEATEEELSFLGGLVVDAVGLREKSAYNQQIGELVANGMSYTDAKAQADKQLWNEALDTALTSFVSGGLMEGARAGRQYLTGQRTAAAQTETADRSVDTPAPKEGQETAQKPPEEPREPAEAVRPQPARRTETERTENTAADERRVWESEEDEAWERGYENYPQESGANQEWSALEDEEFQRTLKKRLGINAAEAVGAKNAAAEKPTADDYIDAMAEGLTRKPEAQEQPKQITDQQIREAIAETIGVDTVAAERYNQNINKETTFGGTNYGTENDRAAGIGDPAQRVAGVQRGDGYEVGRGSEHGGVARHSGILRVSEDLQSARTRKGLQSYDLYDTSASAQEYERALTAGRNSDTANGWCVTPKSAQELAEGNVRTAMNADGTVGVGVAPDGDIVAVFKNKNGGPRKALDTAMPAAIEMGGDRLDCYGEGLVTVYEGYGFVPVARVEFNPEYANEGWTPEKGTPYIYVMMHNGDNAATVTEKMHGYKISTKAELDALPTYGKDGYDDAMAYRDSLFQKRQYAPQGEETGGFGDDAENALYKSLGAAGQKFKHEVRRSKVYDNTYKNATDPEVKSAGAKVVELDPKIAEYDYISEEESVSNARDRLNAPDGLAAELEYLTNKQGWTGEDNDTAMLILKQLQKSEDTAAFKALARAQKAQGTSQGQFVQSFAKYSRDATRATVDAVEMLDKLGKGDVPQRFWKKNGSFEAWKDDILKSTMEIANDIEAVADGDAEAMRNIVRQLANFRKTTAWWGLRSNLTKNAERILRKMDFNTAKDIACAQLAKIPDDFRKRSKGEIIKTVRYNNMLSSLVTVNRNLVGNATMGMIDAFSDATAGRFADMLLSKATGKRTVGNDMRYAGTYLKAAVEAGDMAALMAELDIPAEHEGKYTGRTRTFSPKSSPLGRFMSAYEKYMNYALQVSDEFFAGGTSGAVSKSLEALGEKSGLSEQEIAALGDRVGRRRTFKEGRKLAKASAKVKEGLNMIGTDGFGLGDMALSFAETPAEMGQVAIDYSGTGLLEGLAEMASIIKDVKNGKAIDVERQRKAVSDFGRGMTGVGLIAAFTAFASAGLIAVHDDEDKDKRGLEQSLGLSGAQFNLSAAVRWAKGGNTEWQDDDLVMSIDFLQPFNSQMYIGYLLSQEEDVGEMMKAYPSATFRGIAQSILDIPMMQTFSDLADLATSFGEVSEGDFSAVTDAAGQLIGNQAGSFIPAWMRQTAQYIDPIYRDTTGEDAMDAAKNRIMSGLPFLSQKLPAKYDGLGNLQTRYDNPVLGFFNTFINPGAFNRIQANEIADNLEALGDKSVYPEYLAPKSFRVDGETVMVSGKEMTETYQKTYGDNITALYGGLMESEDFQKLTKEQQIAALKQAKTYATQLAKAAVSDYDDIPEGTAEELTKDIIQEQAEKTISGSFDDLTKAWKNGVDDMAAREALEAAYSTFDSLSDEAKKAITEAATGREKDFLAAKSAGVSTDAFVDLYKKFRDISDDDTLKAGQKANQWASALQRAVEQRLITPTQRDKLKENMQISFGSTLEAVKYDDMIEAGLKAEEADNLMWMLEGLEIQPGYAEVRDVQKWEVIAEDDSMSERERDAVMKMYMTDYDPTDKNPDKTELKYDYARQVFGLSAEEYVDAYRAHVDNGSKADKIDAWKELGYSSREAEMLYRLFAATGTNKIDVVEWYNSK